MYPQFYDQLKLKDNGYTVAAGGPCNWEEGDAWIEVRAVMVQQTEVVATSGAVSTVRKEGDADWWLDASSDSQFTPGRALASARALVHRTDGSTYEFSWPDEVQLQ